MKKPGMQEGVAILAFLVSWFPHKLPPLPFRVFALSRFRALFGLCQVSLIGLPVTRFPLKRTFLGATITDSCL
jgi:hypothetical protein